MDFTGLDSGSSYRITEYVELERPCKDHWVQLPASCRRCYSLDSAASRRAVGGTWHAPGWCSRPLPQVQVRPWCYGGVCPWGGLGTDRAAATPGWWAVVLGITCILFSSHYLSFHYNNYNVFISIIKLLFKRMDFTFSQFSLSHQWLGWCRVWMSSCMVLSCWLALNHKYGLIEMEKLRLSSGSPTL